MASKSIFVCGLGSDIGLHVAKRFAELGYSVSGTYFSQSSLENIQNTLGDAKTVFCDVNDKDSIDTAASDLVEAGVAWDIFLSCPCTPAPVSDFFSSDIDEWEKSFYLNSLGQLRMLHRLFHRRVIGAAGQPQVLMLAGGGVNNAVKEFSAYTSAKIHLIKMVELLAFENSDTKFTIVGPGWTRTKTHLDTLKHSNPSSKKYQEVVEFLNDESRGTPLDDIFGCLNWIVQSKDCIVSGRNFSVVGDSWRQNERERLEALLVSDADMFKLRRHRNSDQR
jgi:NAD(P)-dependent dehydrogenase (short-subunit alcohol dehydrogenase family)